MNKTEKDLLKYIKDCNDIDLEQLERFTPEIQTDIKKIEFLIDTIITLQDENDSLRTIKDYYKRKAYRHEEGNN